MKTSNICKKNIISSFVPIVLLSIVIGTRTRDLVFYVRESRLAWLKWCWVLKHFSLLLLSVLILNLFDNIIIIEFFLFLSVLLKSFLSDSKSWLFNHQVRIVFLLFNHSNGDIVVVSIINSRSWDAIYICNIFPLSCRFKYWQCLFLLLNLLWIILSWSRFFIIFNILWSYFSWTELSSISSLYFID